MCIYGVVIPFNMTASSFLLQRDYFSPPPPITECCVYGTAPAGVGGGAATPLCYEYYEAEVGLVQRLDQVRVNQGQVGSGQIRVRSG